MHKNRCISSNKREEDKINEAAKFIGFLAGDTYKAKHFSDSNIKLENPRPVHNFFYVLYVSVLYSFDQFSFFFPSHHFPLFFQYCHNGKRKLTAADKNDENNATSNHTGRQQCSIDKSLHYEN